MESTTARSSTNTRRETSFSSEPLQDTGKSVLARALGVLGTYSNNSNTALPDRLVAECNSVSFGHDAAESVYMIQSRSSLPPKSDWQLTWRGAAPAPSVATNIAEMAELERESKEAEQLFKSRGSKEAASSPVWTPSRDSPNRARDQPANDAGGDHKAPATPARSPAQDEAAERYLRRRQAKAAEVTQAAQAPAAAATRGRAGQETTSPPSTPAGGREGRQGRSAAAMQTAAPPPEPETAKEKLKAAKAKAKAKLKAAEVSAAARAEAEAEAAAAAATVAEAGAEAGAIAKSSAEQAAAARLAAAKKKASEWKAAAVAGTAPGTEEGDKLERARAKAKASALAATEAAAAAEVQAKAAEEEAARLSALARAKAKTALAAVEAAAAEVAAESAAVQQLAVATAAVAPARPSKRLLKSMKRRDKMLAAMKAAQERRVAP